MTVVAHLAGFVVVPASSTASSSPRQKPTANFPISTTTSPPLAAAFLLDSVVETGRRLDDGIDALDAVSADAVARVPLWDVTQLAPALQVLQGHTATRISDLDLDRYDVDGDVRPVMVAARSASRNDLPENGAGSRSTSSTPTVTGSSPCPPTAPTPTAGPTSMSLADDLVAEPPRAVLR